MSSKQNSLKIIALKGVSLIKKITPKEEGEG